MPELQSPMDQQENVFSAADDESDSDEPFLLRTQANVAPHNRTRRRIWSGSTGGIISDSHARQPASFIGAYQPSSFQGMVKLQLPRFAMRSRQSQSSETAQHPQQQLSHKQKNTLQEELLCRPTRTMPAPPDAVPHVRRATLQQSLPKHATSRSSEYPMLRSDSILADQNGHSCSLAAKLSFEGPTFVPVVESSRRPHSSSATRGLGDSEIYAAGPTARRTAMLQLRPELHPSLDRSRVGQSRWTVHDRWLETDIMYNCFP